MTTIREALRAAAAELMAGGIETPNRDVRRLMAAALGVEMDRLSVVERDPCDAEAAAVFRGFVARRLRREPVSRILGVREFWGRRFRVTDAVLDPRPETECLVELALGEAFGTVLDLGTGSGCIALTLLAERPAARGVASDLSPAALAVAAENAEALGVADRVAFVESDWFSAIEGRFDLIVSNPPYIAAAEMAGLAPEVRGQDPEMALTDGADGLGAYARIAAGAAAHLVPGGRLLVEIGPTQAAAVAALLQAAGLDAVSVHPDLDGRDRVVAARAPGP